MPVAEKYSIVIVSSISQHLSAQPKHFAVNLLNSLQKLALRSTRDTIMKNLRKS